MSMVSFSGLWHSYIPVAANKQNLPNRVVIPVVVPKLHLGNLRARTFTFF